MAMGAVVVFCTFLLYYSIENSINYFSYWRSREAFSEPCQGAIVDTPPSVDFSMIQIPEKFAFSLLIPYRKNGRSPLPSYRATQTVILRCVLTHESLSNELPIFLNFGPLKGEVAVRYNGELISKDFDPLPWLFYIPARIWPQTVTLDLYFRNPTRPILAGPLKIVPITWTQSTKVLVKNIERSFADRNSEYYFKIGHNIVLFTCFGIIFAFGFAYADIAWLTASLFLSTVATLSFFTDFSRSNSPFSTLDWLAILMSYVTLSSSVLNFTRQNGYEKAPWIAGLLTIIAYYLYSFTSVTAPNFSYPNLITYMYSIWVGWICWRHRQSGPSIRRFFKRFMAAVLVVTGGLNTWQFLWGQTITPSFQGKVQMAISLIFAIVLATDFVLYRRRLIISEEERSKQARVAADLDSNFKLARTFQDLLLNYQKLDSLDWMTVNSKIVESAIVSGDWIHIGHQKTRDVVSVFAGDVIGKGPQAALLASTVIGALAAVNESNIRFEDVIRKLSTSLFRILGQAATTLAAVEIDSEGSVCVLNAGHGFIAIIRTGNKVEVIQSSSGPFPLQPGPQKVVVHKTKLLKNERIVILSDGILEGARMQLKMRRLLGEVGEKMSAEALIALLLNFQAGIADDKTVLVITMVENKELRSA